MPEAVLARTHVAFDEEFLAGRQISDFQREVAAKLLLIVEALPPESVTARATIGEVSKGVVFINFVPRQEESAEMTIEIERHTYVHIGVGQETTYGLPNDVWDSRAKDVSGFTAQIVSAVVEGKFRETIYTRAGVPVRCESELNVEGVPVSIVRLDLLGELRRLYRKRWKRDVTYAPYI